MIIGRVLGKYQLGIGDSWIALRIEEMIRSGKLEAVTSEPKICRFIIECLKSVRSNIELNSSMTNFNYHLEDKASFTESDTKGQFQS